ncbi:type VII secretion protein EssB [Sporosarcina sp.]|uniref:type VII secretion protein EssB n=1 Tax=Sporosarcina sp. TaxID=49982 RepID=UPI002611043E|nr:type VII secretion protein EssB [Sporosarcina sp.]
MSKKVSGYLGKLLETELTREENKATFVFQKERIGLKNIAILTFIKDMEPEIKKEILMTDDQLVVNATIPESYKPFESIQLEDEKTKWIFSHQLVEKVKTHPYSRLTVVVSPENIVYDSGMKPFFIHYGVLDSLPPIEQDSDRVWLETRAAVAVAIDGSKTFDEYLKYSDALNLNETEATIMSMLDEEMLKLYIKEQIELLEKKEKNFIKLPSKKWKTWRYTSLGLGLMLIPAIIFTIYYFVYEKPKNEVYLLSHQQFLSQKYSEVVTVLEPQSVKSMPYVILFEAAHSYIVNEKLDEEQKKNVLANITLQTDEDYLKYWIYIGRGEAEEAIDIARSMEDGELITYGLLKRREEIQAEEDLTGEEKQQLLREIDDEVEEYEKLMEQEEKLENETKTKTERQADEKQSSTPQETQKNEVTQPGPQPDQTKSDQRQSKQKKVEPEGEQPES